MADLGEMRVKVGADISELLSKVDAAKAKLGQLTEENGLLKAELKDLNQSLRNNDSAIAKLNLQISKSTAITKEDRAAVAALRKERDGLIASGKQISATIKTTSADLAVNSTLLKEQASVVKKVENAHNGFASGATKVYSGLRKLAYIIPGMGIAGLVSLISGPVIDAFSEWIDTINQVSDALKTMQANQANLNDIYSKSNKEASKQITDLQILYKAATDVTLSMKDRLAAVKGLQNEFPDYFKNIKQENILNGSAKDAYDKLTTSILANARAVAAKNKITELETQRLDALQAQQNAIDQANTRNNQLIKNQGKPSFAGGLVSQGNDYVTSLNAQIAANNLAANDVVKTKDKFIKSIQDQEDFLVKFIGLSNLAKSVETDIKPPKLTKDTQSIKNIETIADILQKLGIQIDFLNQKELLLHTSQAQEKINAIESTVNTLMQKFKLLADNPIIIKLQAQAADIELKDIFKKDTTQRKGLAIDFPVNIKPVTKIDFDPADEQILRDQLLKRLKDLGVTKTIPIPLGVDPVTGLDSGMAPSEKITKNTSTEKLQKTLDDAKKRLKDFKKDTENIFQSFGDSLASSIGQSLGDALSGGKDIFKGLFDSVFTSLGDELENLGALMIKSGLEIKLAKDAFKKLLANPILAIGVGVGLIALGALIKSSIGKSAPGFATGGRVSGPGSKTSDSIPAWLSAGEYIIKADTVQKFGVGFFDKLNRGMIPKFNAFGLPKFATGGFVSPNVIRAAQIPSLSGVAIGGGQTITIKGNFELRNDRLVAALSRGNAQISRNS